MRAQFSLDSPGGTGVLTPRRPRSTPRRREHGSDGGPEPPDDGDGGGGGGGDGDPGPPDDGRRDGDRVSKDGVAEFGLEVGLVSIASMFLVFLGVLLYTRNTGPWEGGVPDQLWLSTMVLGLSSVTFVLTVRAACRSMLQRALRGVAVTLALGLLFLATQIWIWLQVPKPDAGGPVATFYALTGLHALHILGGLVFLASVFARMLRSEPRGSGQAERLRLCSIYWHFMGVIWLVLFAALELLL